MGSPARTAEAAVVVDIAREQVPRLVRPRTAAFAATAAMSLFVAALAFRLSGRELLDGPVMGLLSRFTHRSVNFDLLMRALDRFEMFQGVPVLALAYASFTSAESGVRRAKVVCGCIASAAAAVLSRAIQLGLPHLPRPLFDPTFAYVPPFGADLKTLADWSSFPSDHAALLFGVALATAAANRIFGAFAMAMAAATCFARMYSGEHYPSDILGGALLATACVCASAAAPPAAYAYLSEKAARHRVLLVGIGFMAAAEAAALFGDIRDFTSEVWGRLH